MLFRIIDNSIGFIPNKVNIFYFISNRYTILNNKYNTELERILRSGGKVKEAEGGKRGMIKQEVRR